MFFSSSVIVPSCDRWSIAQRYAGGNAKKPLAIPHRGGSRTAPTTSLTTSATGAIVASVKYFPFGTTRSATGTLDTDKLFTGQRLDDTGLYYYNARYYDATIGRFISADTIVQDYMNPQTLNRYSYCSNNPLKYIDPSGHLNEEDYPASEGWHPVYNSVGDTIIGYQRWQHSDSYGNVYYTVFDATGTAIGYVWAAGSTLGNAGVPPDSPWTKVWEQRDGGWFGSVGAVIDDPAYEGTATAFYAEVYGAPFAGALEVDLLKFEGIIGNNNQWELDFIGAEAGWNGGDLSMEAGLYIATFDFQHDDWGVTIYGGASIGCDIRHGEFSIGVIGVNLPDSWTSWIFFWE
jgi:RHS repeat-associated protein